MRAAAFGIPTHPESRTHVCDSGDVDRRAVCCCLHGCLYVASAVWG